MATKKNNNDKYRVRVVDLYEKETPYKEDDKYYANGANNDYPQLVYRSILNSPTGCKGVGLLQRFIAGAGIAGQDVIVDPKKGTLLSELRINIARDFAYQNGVFCHRSIKINFENEKTTYETAGVKVLPFQKCRVGKADDQENLGKIWYDDFDKNGAGKFSFAKKDKETKKYFYPFSDNPDVIRAQIVADAKLYVAEYNKNNKGKKLDIKDFTLQDMIKHYRGQVLYVNLTPEFIYPVSKFDSVINDMDTEFRISVFTNRQVRSGFLGKLMLLINSTDDEENDSLGDQVEEWLGVENTGDVVIAEMAERVEDMADLITQVKLESEYDEDKFAETPKRLRTTILGAADNAPEPLIFAGEGSAMFGNSGEQLREMQKFYQDQTKDTRMALEKTLRRLGYNVGIEPIIKEEVAVEAQDENAKAQATLRGSVGGVTGILQIQTSVSEGTTTLDAAIATLVHIYGFDSEVAAQIIGQPKIITTNTAAAT